MLKVDGASGGSVKPSPKPDLNSWFSLLLVADVAVDEILSGREVKWDMAYNTLFGLHGETVITKGSIRPITQQPLHEVSS